MAKSEAEFHPQAGPFEAETPTGRADEWKGFPKAAIADTPGQERKYPLDRIERIVGSIM